jgi:hypothetical protein
MSKKVITLKKVDDHIVKKFPKPYPKKKRCCDRLDGLSRFFI